MSFTLHREGTLPPHFACFLSCQVPLFLPPGARVIRRRRGSLDRCNAGPSSWELDGGPASPSMWTLFPFQPRPSAMRAGSSVALGTELRGMAGLSTRPSGGVFQPVGQNPAVPGADGSLGVAVVAAGYGAAGVSM